MTTSTAHDTSRDTATGIGTGTSTSTNRTTRATAPGPTRPAGPRRSRRPARAALAGLAIALSATTMIAGCSALGIGSGAGLGGDWGLVAGEDATGTFDLSIAGVTMLVQGDTVSGTAACNSYGGTVVGSVSEAEQPLRVEQLFQTEMACLDDGVMELEQRYLNALAAVSSARRVDADTVELIGPSVRLEFDLLVEG